MEIINILTILNQNELKIYQDISALERDDTIRIPKSHFQIGTLKKDPADYSDIEWEGLEKLWHTKFTEAMHGFLQLFTFRMETSGSGTETPPRNQAKYCFCLALALFRMVDKRTLEIDDTSEPIHDLYRFVLACWLLAEKLTEFINDDADFKKYQDDILTKFVDKKNDLFLSSTTTPTPVNDYASVVLKRVLEEEVKIVESLNFYLWSPIHISVWCRKNPLDPLTGQASIQWMIGNMDNENTLLDSVLFYLKRANIQIICFDLQNFVEPYSNNLETITDLDDLSFT